MTRLEDVIHTKYYGDIEIYSQDVMEYFFQDKETEKKEDRQRYVRRREEIDPE